MEEGGYDDWELPGIYQLQTIADSAYSPAINTNYFNIKTSQYWSGSRQSSLESWYYDFQGDGYASTNLSNVGSPEYYALCVRSGSFYPFLILSIDADEIQGVAPFNASFHSTMSGGSPPYAVSWNFGDGSSTNSNVNPSHIYEVSGAYTATCTVTDDNGLTAEKKINITVEPAEVCTGFVDNGDGTLTDIQTGLMWQQADPGELKWEEAKLYCENLVLGKYNDWRLPTMEELTTLVDYGKSSPPINLACFPEFIEGRYWSSTYDAGDAGSVWHIGFWQGYDGTYFHQYEKKLFPGRTWWHPKFAQSFGYQWRQDRNR